MASNTHDIDRDPEFLADLTLLLLYAQANRTGRGRSARWMASTQLDEGIIARLAREHLLVNNGDGSVTFTMDGVEGARHVFDMFVGNADDMADAVEERIVALLALQHMSPQDFPAMYKDGVPAGPVMSGSDRAALGNVAGPSGSSDAAAVTHPPAERIGGDDYDPEHDLRAFRIRLELRGDDGPLCWRLVEVPASCTFLELHVIIQECMRWLDCHLFDFSFTSGGQKRRLDEQGDLHDDFSDWMTPDERRRQPVRSPARATCLGEVFPRTRNAVYSYDYGDGWLIDVKVVKTVRRRGSDEPVVLDGEGAAPPEDVGGPGGYGDFLRIVNGPAGPERDEMLEWADDQGYMDHFDVEDIRERMGDWQLHLLELMRNLERAGV